MFGAYLEPYKPRVSEAPAAATVGARLLHLSRPTSTCLQHAWKLLDTMNAEYTATAATSKTPVARSATCTPTSVVLQSSIKLIKPDFLDSAMGAVQEATPNQTEIKLYQSHAYPCQDSNCVLQRWAVSEQSAESTSG